METCGILSDLSVCRNLSKLVGQFTFNAIRSIRRQPTFASTRRRSVGPGFTGGSLRLRLAGAAKEESGDAQGKIRVIQVFII